MAYRRRTSSRNRTAGKRVRRSYGKSRSTGYRARKPVRSSSRKRVRRNNTGRSGRRVLQTLRIELAPGLSIGGGGGSPAIGKPIQPRRTRHF